MSPIRRVDFRPYDREFAADPYPTYRRLREDSPIFYSPDFGLTFFTRYADIVKLLADRRVGRSMDPVLTPEELAERRHVENWDRLPTYDRFVRSNLLETEGLQHSRLRQIVSKVFNATTIRAFAGVFRNWLMACCNNLSHEDVWISWSSSLYRCRST